jgi:hypothetical protein
MLPRHRTVMISTNLQGVAELVIRRARRQGYVVAQEVREELRLAGVPETMWKDVVALGRPMLSYRKGRYYFSPPVSERVRQEQTQQQDVLKVIRQLIRHHRKEAKENERRGEDRFDFVQTVKVITEENREMTLISRDLSSTGIRLIGTHRLLGQKVRVLIPRPGSDEPWTFRVRILWTCAVGEDLVENGGSFLEVTVAATTAAAVDE